MDALNSEEQEGWHVKGHGTVVLLIQFRLPATSHTQESCGVRDSGGLLPQVSLGSATQ